MGVPSRTPSYLFAQCTGTLSQIPAMMALAIFFNRKASLSHSLYN